MSCLNDGFINCLLGFNVSFIYIGHIAAVPACSSGTLTNVLPYKKCHATDTGHDTPPCHSLPTQGIPVAVVYIDVEHHTGIHNYPF